MWSLKRSRGLFFARTGMPHTSFWNDPRVQEIASQAGGRIPVRFRNWDVAAPDSQANCPILHDLVRELADLVDPRWRATVKNLYAGRAFSDPVEPYETSLSAAMEKTVNAGIAVLGFEFTTCAAAYIAIHDKYTQVMYRRESAEDVELLGDGVRRQLDLLIDQFKLDGPLAFQQSWVMQMSSPEAAGAFRVIAGNVELWTLAHEVSHHLARHDSSRRDKGIQAILQTIIGRSALADELLKLSASQRSEVEADLLATLIVAEHFRPSPSPQGRGFAVMNAAAAAVYTLLSIGHARQQWFSSPGDEHPGAFERLDIILAMICELYGSELYAPTLPSAEHATIARVSASLMAFATWTLSAQGSREIAERLRERWREEGIGVGASIEHLSSAHTIYLEFCVKYGLLADQYRESLSP